MKKIILLFTLFCCLMQQSKLKAQTCNLADSLELVNFYNQCGGANWHTKTNWLTINPVRTWHGITLHTSGANIGRVKEIITNNTANVRNGYGNNLTGAIPNFSLPNLTYLEIGYNTGLTGNIPNFSLPNLTVLNIIDNAGLTGAIPNFSLPNLTVLNIWYNTGLTGAIPNFSLPNLTYLSIESNAGLTGAIPNFSLPNLTYLYISHNAGLTGAIPNFSLPKLINLHLANNKLSGNIPNITFANATYNFGVQGNKFTFGNIANAWTALNNANNANGWSGYAPQDTLLPLSNNSGILTADLGGASLADLTYTWYRYGVQVGSPIVGNNTYTPIQSGTYTFSVTHATITRPNVAYRNLILNSQSLAVTVCTPFTITANNSTIASCANNYHGSISLSSSASLTGYSYSYNGSTAITGTGTTIPNLAAGIYSITATDVNGCPSTPISTTVGTSSTVWVTNTNDTGLGSLRAAIDCANGHVGADTILFNISGTGQKVITLSSALPPLTNVGTVIDGGTWLNVTTPKIKISGTKNGMFSIYGCILRNLHIENISNTASRCIYIEHSGYNTEISNNIITVSGNDGEVYGIGVNANNVSINNNIINIVGNFSANHIYTVAGVSGHANMDITNNTIAVQSSHKAMGIEGSYFNATNNTITVFSPFLPGLNSCGLCYWYANNNTINGNTISSSSDGIVIHINNTIPIQIGNISANKLENCKWRGIYCQGSKTRIFPNNIFKCNALDIDSDTSTPIISNANATTITGTAIANSTIDVFKITKCTTIGGQSQQTQTLLGTVQSGASGNWVLNNQSLIMGDIVTAFATPYSSGVVSGSTSGFAAFKTACSPFQISATPTTATCSSKAQISLSTTAGTIASYQYFGGAGSSASGSGQGTLIANVPAGTYTVVATLSNGCTSDQLANVRVDHSNRQALAAWYDQSNTIQAWNQNVNWKNNTTLFNDPQMSGWTGITVEPNYGCVTAIDLQAKNIAGALPNMAGLDSLKTMQLYGNHIDGTLNVSYPNLKLLNLSNNKIDAVATCNLPKLEQFFLENNKSNVANGTTSIAAQNFPSLKYFYAQSSKINSFGGLIAPELLYLYLQSNKISSLPTLNFPKAQLVYLSDNQLVELPNMTLSPNWFQLQVNDNKLDFSDFLTWQYLNSNAYVVYAPQQKIAAPVFGTNQKLSVSPGGNVSQTTFFWYLNGVLQATVSGDNTYLPSISGNWHCEMTHTGITQSNTNGNRALRLVSESAAINACSFTGSISNANINANVAPATASYTVTPPAGTNYTYNWYKGNWSPLSPSNVLNPTFNHFTQGNKNYDMYLVITIGANCKDTLDFTLNIPCGVGVSAGSNKTTCAGKSVTLNALPSGGAPNYTYEWFEGTNPVPFATTQSVSVTNNNVGTVTYRTAVVDGLGCDNQAFVTVNSLANPVANAGVDKFINCINTTAEIGTAAQSGLTYKWSVTGSSTILSTQSIFDVNPTITTSYTLTVTNADGCTHSDEVLVNVDRTTPTANAGADVTLNCLTTNATLGVASVSGYSYEWKASNGTNVLATQATFGVSPSVTTTYQLKVTGTNGCTVSDDVVVSVDRFVPAISVTDATINCNVLSANLAASVPSPYVPVSILWNGNIANNTSVSPSTTTTYNVVVTMQNGCTGTATQTVFVDTTPPNATINSSASILNCTTPSATLSVAAGNAYAWAKSNAPSTVIGTQNTLAVNVNTNTSYQVSVTATNGCTATSNYTILVNKTIPLVGVGQDVTLNCITTSHTVTPVVNTQGTALYAWSSGESTASITVSPSISTNYKLTVTDSANGCRQKDDFNVSVDRLPPTFVVAANNNQTTVNCHQNTNYTYLFTNYYVPGATYAWNTQYYNNSANYVYVNPSVTTIYTATVTSPSNGCTSVGSITITADKEQPTANAGADLTIDCNNPTANLDGSNSSGTNGSPLMWKWALGSDPWNAIFTSNTNGTYSVSPGLTTTYALTVINQNNGCMSAADYVTVSVNNKPTVNAGWDKYIDCRSQAVTFVATGYNPNHSLAWYEKNKPNVILSTTDVLSFAQHPAKQTIYVVKVTDPINNCSSEDEVQLNAYFQLPQVTTPAGADKIYCTGANGVELGATAVWGNTYKWSNDSTSAKVAVYPTVSTEYYLTVTNNWTGCSLIDTVQVTVNQATAISIAAIGALSYCTNDVINTTLNVASSTGSGTITYAWFRAGFNGNGIFQNNTTSSFSPSFPGKYYCVATGACGTKKSNAIVITQPHESEIVGKLCINEPLKVVRKGNAIPNTYQWQRKQACNSGTSWADIVSATDSIHIPTITGAYRCILTYNACIDMNNAVCVTTRCQTNINKESDNNNSGNEATIQGQDIINPSDNEVMTKPLTMKLYPNPAAERAMIQFVLKEKGNIKLTLSDASGMSRSVLLEGNYEAGEHFTSLESSVHRLVSGLYFITLRAGNQVITQKLIILN